MTNFDIIRNIMARDGSLDEEIMGKMKELKRDITQQEENEIVLEVVRECEERMVDLSCSITEAYWDVMY